MSQPDVLAMVAAGPLAAGMFDSNSSPTMPVRPVKVAPHVRDVQEVNPASATAGPGTSNDVFEIPKMGNHITKLFLVLTWAAISDAAALTGTGTFFYPVDGIGIFSIKEIRIIYSQNKLQRILPYDLWIMHNKWYNDEVRATLDDMVKLNLTPAQRTLLRLKAYKTKLPLHNFISQQDLSQAIAPHGLSQKLRIEVDYAPQEQLFMCDGTNSQPFTTLAGYWTNRVLSVEFDHSLAAKRAAMVNLYSSRSGVRYLVHDFVYPPSVNPLGTGATVLGGAAVSTTITGLNSLVHSLVFLFQYAALPLLV